LRSKHGEGSPFLKCRCPFPLCRCRCRSPSLQAALCNPVAIQKLGVILRECAESIGAFFLFAVAVIMSSLRTRTSSLPAIWVSSAALAPLKKGHSDGLRWGFAVAVAVSSLRGRLCPPAAIQKLILFLPWSWSWSWSWSFPRPLRERAG
jgi:hypothetical protein